MSVKLKKFLSNSASFVLTVAIFFILVRIVWRDWGAIRAYNFNFNFGNIVLALIFGIVNIYSLSAVWAYLFRTVEKSSRLTGWAGFKIFVYAWFSRYLPGRFWAPLSKIYIGAKDGLGKKSLGLASILELLLSTVSHFILVWCILIFAFRDYFPILQYTVGLALALAIMIVFLHPAVLSRTLNFFLKKIKKTEIDRTNFPGYGRLVLTTLLYFLPNFFVASSFVFLARSFYDFSPVQSILLWSAFIVANFLAKVAFFIPIGIGVREGILVAILQFFLPLPLATLVSLLSRVWFIVVDVAVFAGVFLNNKIIRVQK